MDPAGFYRRPLFALAMRGISVCLLERASAMPARRSRLRRSTVSGGLAVGMVILAIFGPRPPKCLTNSILKPILAISGAKPPKCSKPNHEISREIPNEPREESRLGFTLLKLTLEDSTKNHEREPQNHEARNEVAQVITRTPPAVRGFVSARAEKRFGSTISKLPLEDLQNRGPAEGGRGEQTSPRTRGSNTPTKVDGLSTYPLFLGRTWGHFHTRPSFGKDSGT